MEEMMIQGTEIEIKEYKCKRVVTFKDIDAVHRRPIGTAHRNFKVNRQRFISGVDFFKVCADEIRLHKIAEISPKAHEDITLITESGYLMLVKSFTDDLAWKVQRELVDTYFRIRAEPEVVEQTVTVTEPVTREETPSIYLEASRIMSGCLEGNRPYVLNILRHIVPDVDQLEVQQKVTEVKTEVAALPDKKHNIPPFWKHGVDIDVNKLKMVMNARYISPQKLACDIGVCTTTVKNWLTGNSKPLIENRTKICVTLGEDEDFLTPRRTRRVK